MKRKTEPIDEPQDRRRLPPLHANMTRGEREAAWLFLNALVSECRETVKELMKCDVEPTPKYLINSVLYWQHVAAGYELAKSRLGLPEFRRGKDAN